MNIALTEIQPIQSEASSRNAGTAKADDRFNKLFDRQLDQDKELSVQSEYPQVIDNKDKVRAIEESADNSEGELAESPAGSELMNEFYGQISIDVSESVETSITIADQPTEISESSLIVSADQSATLIAKNGEVLPANGNTLPPRAGQIEVAAVQLISGQQLKAERTTIPASLQRPDLDTPPADGEESFLLRSVREPSGTEIPTINKMELFAGKLNASQNAVQIGSLDITGTADVGNNFFRVPGSPNTGLQQLTLPPHLETLSPGSTRDSAALGGGLGERIQWMVNQKLNSATIRMDPPMLGRLEVQIQLVDDVTQVTINTQHAQTRDMIDSASVRLREILQENGHQNVNVDVSQEQQQSFEQPDDNGGFAAEEGVESQELSGHAGQPGSRFFYSDSVVDYFA